MDTGKEAEDVFDGSECREIMMGWVMWMRMDMLVGIIGVVML